jgi:superfamily I DNA and/or RNA helicase
VCSREGSEWDYVILSTVRSLPEDEIPEQPNQYWRRQNMGFITDEHQINVAITRAAKGLIIVGQLKTATLRFAKYALLTFYCGSLSRRKV